MLLALVASVLAVQSASAIETARHADRLQLDDMFRANALRHRVLGDIAVAGNYDGFRVFNRTRTQLLVS